MSESDERYVQPNAKHRHIYVVFRVDLPVSASRPEHIFTLTKAFTSEAQAIEEVERLNGLNADKGCLYAYKLARLVEGGSGG